jgi:hypothetical protein
LCADWIAVFIPSAPAGVIRWAASPTRKPLPNRKLDATSADMVNGIRVSSRTSTAGSPIAVWMSSVQRSGVKSAGDSPRSGNHCRA